MDAIILVGGRGTRLLPLTAARHKSLVPVCNRPAIDYLLAWLERSGIERVILALGVGNDDLATAYPPGAYGGMRVDHVIERERRESGGAIREGVKEAGVEGRFLVLNGDVYVDFDLGAAVAAHEARSAELTLCLTEVEDPSLYGIAVTAEDDRIVGFVEKPPRDAAPSRLANAGVWIFEPHLAEEIPPGAVRVEETLFPSLVARGRPIYGYRAEGIWADIGSVTGYLDLNRRLLAAGEIAIAPEVACGTDASIRASAIGGNSRVGDGASIEDSILWEAVDVEAGARVRASVLADGVHVGSGAIVERATAGQNAWIAPGAHVPPGTRLRPGARYYGQDV